MLCQFLLYSKVIQLYEYILSPCFWTSCPLKSLRVEESHLQEAGSLLDDLCAVTLQARCDQSHSGRGHSRCLCSTVPTSLSCSGLCPCPVLKDSLVNGSQPWLHIKTNQGALKKHQCIGLYLSLWLNTHTHTQHKICHLNHFKAYSSVVLRTFTLLPNHHCYPPAELFHHPKLKLCTPLTITPRSSSHPSCSGDHLYLYILWESQVALAIKNLPANAGDIRQPGSIPGSGRAWQPASVFLPGKFHGQRSLAGYNSWIRKELDMTLLSDFLNSTLRTSYMHNHIVFLFGDWFVSLSMMSSSFFHAVACVRISFLFKAE